jgi:hypothetical protein
VKRRIITALMLGMAGFAASSFATTSGDVVISPESKGAFIDKFFKDYKSKGHSFSVSDTELDELFIDDGLNGIRTPIWGTEFFRFTLNQYNGKAWQDLARKELEPTNP